MTRYIVVNTDAGQAMSLGVDGIAQLVESVFGKHVRLIMEKPPTLFDTLSQIMENDHPDAVIVGGGDGTVSFAARLALTNNVTLGVLPLGTLNLFARALGMPTNLTEAVSAIANAKIGAVDVGFVNGEAFFNHVSFGIHPKLIKIRDQLSYEGQFSKIASGAKALVRTGKSVSDHKISFDGEFDAFSAETHLAIVAVNPIPSALGKLPFRPGQRYGKLGLYVWSSTDESSIVPVIGDLLLGRWSEASDVIHHESASVDLITDGKIHASIDGEVKMIPSPITIAIKPKALSALLPAGPNGAVPHL